MVLPMARDLGKYKIRVAALAPGIFETPISPNMPEFFKKKLEKNIALGRAGNPDELAHMVSIVIENGYINGVVLRIDGATRLFNL